MSLEALQSGRITHASQDGSREFLSLLACIGADGDVIPPALIYQGESGDLQDTWLEDWTPETPAYFGVSKNGWSCDLFGLRWLDIFHRHTKDKAGNRRRLLIVDGHSSHVNLRFLEKCDELRILVLVLPPHSTHRLQPLDVSLFSPLATYYTNELQQLMMSSYGIVSMSKRKFWSLFWPAWQQAFSPANIASGFAKTGIWPYAPDVVLAKITKPPPPLLLSSIETSQTIQTPMTCRAIRRTQRQFHDAPNSPLLAKIFRANERLAAQHSVDQHVVKGLITALQDEKKRRKRGKRLNLIGEEDSGPQFFSPGRIQAARDWQAAKEQEEQQRQQNIIDRKAQAAAKRQQKEDEKTQRAVITLQKRQIAAELREQKAAERQAQKELKETIITQRKTKPKLQQQSAIPIEVQKTSKKQIKSSDHTTIVSQSEERVLATSRGRRVQLPQRFII
jgi:hypothetical protein